MEEYIDRSVWTNYFNEFTKRNQFTALRTTDVDPGVKPKRMELCKSPFEFLSSVTLPPPPVCKNSK